MESLHADKSFVHHSSLGGFMSWLQDISWHYCLRLPCDVNLHGPRRHPIELMYLWPAKGEAVFYHNVGLWLDGEYRCNIVLANVKGVKEPWAVITDEEPSLQTLWQYGFLSYLKIGLRWLKGVLHKGGHVAWGNPRRSCCPCRALFSSVPLLPRDPQPCFASKKAQKQYYDAIWFSRIRELKCRT